MLQRERTCKQTIYLSSPYGKSVSVKGWWFQLETQKNKMYSFAALKTHERSISKAIHPYMAALQTQGLNPASLTASDAVFKAGTMQTSRGISETLATELICRLGGSLYCNKWELVYSWLVCTVVWLMNDAFDGLDIDGTVQNESHLGVWWVRS